ncbi:MAG: hypothetical protein N2258_00670 [Brevinematales bacterium]|nr:hypothetical protein [Brevinematales bacterium]
MIPLQTKLKIYIAISITIHFIGVVSLVILYIVYNNWQQNLISPKVLGEILNRIVFFFSITLILSFIYGSYVYFFAFKKGINKYKEIKKRLEQVGQFEDFNLKSISIPDEDEFGNIGIYLNFILNKIEKYNELKTERLFVEHEKTKLLADFLNIPILFVSIENGEKIVKHYNETFEKIFARKNENEFYDIINRQLTRLSIANYDGVNLMDIFNKMSDEEIVDSFIDKEFEDALDYAIAKKTKTTIKNKEIKTINGKELYLSEEINIYPVIDRQDNPIELIIFFDKFKKIKNLKK